MREVMIEMRRLLSTLTVEWLLENQRRSPSVVTGETIQPGLFIGADGFRLGVNVNGGSYICVIYSSYIEDSGILTSFNEDIKLYKVIDMDIIEEYIRVATL